jgi:hypothetical protein
LGLYLLLQLNPQVSKALKGPFSRQFSF